MSIGTPCNFLLALGFFAGRILGCEGKVSYKSGASVRNVHDASDMALDWRARQKQVDLVVVVACHLVSTRKFRRIRKVAPRFSYHIASNTQ